MNLSAANAPKPLNQLFGEIDACEAARPDFQHDVVWKPVANQEPFVSIASNAVGSPLRIRNTQQLFDHQKREDGQKFNSHLPGCFVPNGRPHFTSVYQVWYGGNHRRYHLALRLSLASRARSFRTCPASIKLASNTASSRSMKQLRSSSGSPDVCTQISGAPSWWWSGISLNDDQRTRG